ncbi:MAG: LysE family translocator [Burkholderiales bacterium]|jgi:homoserine/homoserine lactone efflux protein
MKLYPVFLLMAFVTVLIPGPGVVMTLTNSLRYGLRGTFGGILGIAVGAFVVAAISSTSVGVILATSTLAFTILKFFGAAYLFYLGVKFWRSPPFRFVETPTHKATFSKRFLEGLSLQLTNPKAVFFFLSVLPQFIDPAQNYVFQFSALVLTYSALVVLIHTIYALVANRAKYWLASERGGKAIRRVGGATFLFFGAALATAKR